MQLNAIKKECNKMKMDGKSSKEIIEYLHQSQLTIIDSMKIIMELYGVPLADAKEMVANHPVWSSVVDATDFLHDELERNK